MTDTGAPHTHNRAGAFAHPPVRPDVPSYQWVELRGGGRAHAWDGVILGRYPSGSKGVQALCGAIGALRRVYLTRTDRICPYCAAKMESTST